MLRRRASAHNSWNEGRGEPGLAISTCCAGWERPNANRSFLASKLFAMTRGGDLEDWTGSRDCLDSAGTATSPTCL